MADEDPRPHDRLMPSHNGSTRPPRPRSLSENESAQTDDVTISLVPPVIICDDVASAPATPTNPHDQNKILRNVLSLSNSHMDVGTSVTPSGSLLGINKPIELRESTLTVNYPENGGKFCLQSLTSDLLIIVDPVSAAHACPRLS